MTSVAAYYARRAAEYERIYARAERQADLRALDQVISQFFTDKQVLELAAGTGYWSESAARYCANLTGIDINEEVLSIARAKKLRNSRFIQADLYALDDLQQSFDAGLLAHWWSHVDKRQLADFVTKFHQHLEPGACVLLLDNNYVTGSSTRLSRTDRFGNTFQQRQLADGSEHEIMKNFPTATEIQSVLGDLGTCFAHVDLEYYWYVTYTVVKTDY